MKAQIVPTGRDGTITAEDDPRSDGVGLDVYVVLADFPGMGSDLMCLWVEGTFFGCVSGAVFRTPGGTAFLGGDGQCSISDSPTVETTGWIQLWIGGLLVTIHVRLDPASS